MNTLDKFNKQDKEVIDIVNKNFAKVRHESIKQAQEQEKRSSCAACSADAGG